MRCPGEDRTDNINISVFNIPQSEIETKKLLENKKSKAKPAIVDKENRPELASKKPVPKIMGSDQDIKIQILDPELQPIH